MAPCQTTTSPRRLRKQALREARRDQLMNENYQLGMQYEEKYRYWNDVLLKQNPEMSPDAAHEWAITLALQNRKQRRAKF